MTQLTLNNDNGLNISEEDIIMTLTKYDSLEFDSMENKELNILHKSKKFTIVLPSESGSGFSIRFDDNSLSFLNLINILAKRKKLSFDKLLKKIDLAFKETEVTNEYSSINDSEFDAALKTVSDFDLNVAKDISDIEKNIPNSVSPLFLESENKKRGQLFSSDTVSKLILKEYKTLKNSFKDSSRFELATVDNNIYRWRVKMRNFSSRSVTSALESINKRHGYNYVEVELHFHSDFYPNYPIKVKYIRPKLNNSLMHKISNLKMVNNDYWTPSRNAEYIINNLYTILNKHADINTTSEMNNPKLYKDGAYMDLEDDLIKLSSFCGDLNISANLDDNDDKYIKLTVNTTKNKNKGVGKGIGYESDGYTNWSMSEYAALEREKEILQTSSLKRILEKIQNHPQEDIQSVYETIDGSYLIIFLKNLFKETSMIEMNKKKELFDTVFQIMQFIANEQGIFLFADSEKEQGLYSIFQDLVTSAEREKKIVNSDKLLQSDTILTLNEMIKPVYDNYIKEKGSTTSTDKRKSDNKDPVKSEYEDTLKKYSIIDAKIKENNFCSFSTYGGSNVSTYSPKQDKVVRILREITFLEKSPAINYDSSIFYAYDEKYMSCARAVISGPPDTPYDSGLFVFDILYTDNYPNSSPLVEIVNNGKKRFNPNLYNSGKVCLSLLGTWGGNSESENWSAKDSTVYQVLISIQSMILIDEPYFNEPGYERSKGTPNGNAQSKAYNDNIRLYTMTHAINDMMERPGQYDGFEEVVKNHFRIKKDYILKTCGKWVDEASKTSKTAYAQQYARMQNLFKSFE